MLTDQRERGNQGTQSNLFLLRFWHLVGLWEQGPIVIFFHFLVSGPRFNSFFFTFVTKYGYDLFFSNCVIGSLRLWETKILILAPALTCIYNGGLEQ
jgi:hypothetical protein